MNQEMTNQDTNRFVGIAQVAIFLLIVAVGIGSRLWLVEFPNFKPVAALCLFSGFFFRRYAFAMIAAVLILLVSDWQLGGYEWQLATSVYGSMFVACGLGWLIKSRINASDVGLNRNQVGGFVVSSLVMSTVFFLMTNAAVWQWSGWYARDVSGGIACFVSAISFYRWTIMGDMTFTLIVIGTYQACSVAVAQFARSLQTA